MSATTFHIATLHRGKYMFILLVGVCIVTAIAARLPVQEIAKILIVLASLPFLLFLSTQWSKAPSQWTIHEEKISILFQGKPEEVYPLTEIKYIRNLPRSGGNLLMLFIVHKKTPKRYWRNKLFQKVDDLDALIHALKQRDVEYYYM